MKMSNWLIGLITATSIVLPLSVRAQDFSQTFVGYINNQPVKLKLISVDGHIRGNYAYKNDFSVSYVPGENFLAGKQTDNQIQLKSPGDNNPIQINGNLVLNNQYGIDAYSFKGTWNDPQKNINQTIELRPLILNADTSTPIMNSFMVNKKANEFTTIESSYPQFKGQQLTTNERQINTDIQNFITQQIKSFHNSVKEAVKERSLTELPGDAFKLYVNNAVTNVAGIFSIRFKLFSSMHGAAHPNTNFISLNFNSDNGHQMTLADLFKPNTDYLQLLSKLVRPILVKKLYPQLSLKDTKNPDIQLLLQGTKPIASNFKVWNIYQNNLMVTFPAYQVAAYAFGAQTVIIPSKELMNDLKQQFINP